jgi:hypothetical protein
LCIYLVCIFAGYFALVAFESDAGNPDITGSGKDLVNILRDVVKLGQVACVTKYGRAAKTWMYVVSMFFGITSLGRMLIRFLDEKIRRLLKMIPWNSKDHVVICNWTPKVKEVIRELRSLHKTDQRRVIIVARQAQQPLERLEEYEDVYIFHGEPKDRTVLEDRRVNISLAHAALVLADDKHCEEPDATTLLILEAIKEVLDKGKGKNAQDRAGVGAGKGQSKSGADGKKLERPKIVAEVAKNHFKKIIEENSRAHKVIHSGQITGKLFAQATATPEVIDFVNEIVETTNDNNEVYILKISDVKKLRKRIGEECTFRGFTEEILKEYDAAEKKSSENPITVIGVRPEEGLKINPKGDEFSKIKDKIKAAVVLAWQKPKRPLMK